MIETPTSPNTPTAKPGTPTMPGGFMSFLKQLGQRDLSQLPVLAALAAIAIYFNFFLGPDLNGIFLGSRNLSNLSLEMVTMGTISLAAVIVLLLGEIDLSLAAVAGFSGAIMVTLSVNHHFSAPAAILAALVAGLVIGTVNGLLVAVIRVPSFIVTLAALIFYSGFLEHILLPQTTIRLTDPGLTDIASNYLSPTFSIGLPILAVVLYAVFTIGGRLMRQRRGLEVPSIVDPLVRIGALALLAIVVISVYTNYLGIPISLTILFVLVVIFWVVLRFTTFGRHVYATGGNIEAARRAGINVVMVRVSVFALASMLAAIAGMLEASRQISASAQVDPVLLLDAIAAAVIGGVSLFGGRGSPWAVFLGGLVIQGLLTGLTLRGESSDIQQMIEGGALILAIILDALIRRRNAVSGR